MIQQTPHCLNHPKTKSEYIIFISNKGYHICDRDIEWLQKIHQLVIEVKEK